MGNCCRPASSMECDGEDWSSLKSNNNTRKTSRSSSKVFDEAHIGLCLGKVQKEKLLGGLRVSPDANGQVKLRITKKELEELLGVIDNENENNQRQILKNQVGGRASAEQVLLRLINARDNAIANKHHGPWRPVLESIPES